MLKIGRIVDNRYEILKEIDRGGMSIVYLAQDNRLNKFLAIKDIRKNSKINTDILLGCLRAETELLTVLDHHTLPKIYDVIEGEDHIYVVMDYIEGEALIKKINREGACTQKDVIEWAKQLSEVLGYLHTRKPYPIIYRDMKPHNIMLTPDKKIKLIDFGISIKSDLESKVLNFATNTYAAPEQLNKQSTDARTDIYSLGVTLHHLVTGKKRIKGEELISIREVNPSLSEGLEYIISKCTMENPEDRYQNASELNKDLCRVEKLTKKYRKEIIKGMSIFVFSTIFFFISLGVTIFAKTQIELNSLEIYKGILNKATIEMVNDNEAEAIKILDEAIVVEPNNARAYLKMLDIYKEIGDIEAGLDKIEGYINDGYGNIDKNDDVLYKVAMTYLNEHNYPIAAKYFKKVSKRKYPAVKYYRTISESMSSMDVDYTEFSKELESFEEYVDTLTNDSNKMNDYIALANIYSSYKGQISNSNDKVIEIIGKADGTLNLIEDTEIQVKYELELSQKLGQAYHSKGNSERDISLKNESYNKAIIIYNDLIGLDVKNAKDIFIKIGDIYSEQGEFNKAIHNYKLAIGEEDNSIKSYLKIVSTLLDIEQAKAGEKDYTSAKEYYDKVLAIEGIEKNSEFKKVKRRVESLGIY